MLLMGISGDENIKTAKYFNILKECIHHLKLLNINPELFWGKMLIRYEKTM